MVQHFNDTHGLGSFFWQLFEEPPIVDIHFSFLSE